MRPTSPLVFFLLFLALLLQFSKSQQCLSTVNACIDPTCGVPYSFTANTVACKPCSIDDIGAKFTQCDTNGATKTLFYFWRPPATCLASAEVPSLPQPITNIPCNLNCTYGQFLNTTSKRCETCLPGSFSSWNSYENADWRTIPSPFKTSCSIAGGNTCQYTWKPKGDYVEIAIQAAARSITGMESALEATFQISAPNSYVRFEYQHEDNLASYEDSFMRFSVNDKTYLYSSGSQFGQSTHFWRKISFLIETPGTYTLKWAITKSSVNSQNLARIRTIEVDNASLLTTKCTSCDAGFYSDSTTYCQRCPPMTYSESPNSVSCTPCPDGTFSYSGATQCTPYSDLLAAAGASFVPCTNADIQYSYSICDGAKRTKTASWKQPLLCNSTDIALPAPVDEECKLSCEAGFELKTAADSTQSCVPCGNGQYSSANSTCNYCDYNMVPSARVFKLDSFEPSILPQLQSSMRFKTSCEGECITKGWQFKGDRIETGDFNGASNSILKFYIDQTSTDTQLEIDYVASCYSNGSLEIGIGPEDIDYRFTLRTLPCNNKCGDTAVQTISISFIYEMANVPVTIAFYSKTPFNAQNLASPASADCNKVQIKRIQVTGTSLGGSKDCSACKLGQFVNGTRCGSCQGGFVGNGTICTSCPANYYSSSQALSCAPCGNGMISSPASPYCDFKYGACSFEVEHRKFNWSILDNVDFSYNYYGYYTFYFNLCRQRSSKCGNNLICANYNYGNELIPLGDNMFMDYLPTSQSLILTVTGQDGNCFDYDQGIYVPFTTHVELGCRGKNGGTENQYTASGVSLGSCEVYVRTEGRGFCSECKEEDYTYLVSQCGDNYKREKRWVVKNQFCAGGFSPSLAPEYEDCWGAAATAPYWVIGIVGVLFILSLITVLAIVIVLSIKYRKLSNEYNKLSSLDRQSVNLSGGLSPKPTPETSSLEMTEQHQ